VIDDRARDLGRLLGQSGEYKALQRANEQLQQDAECRRLLDEVRRLDEEIERGARAGTEPAPAQLETYERAVRSLQASSVYQQWVAAQTNFEKVMLKVNAQIAEGIRTGAASPLITLG
jgi:cell fate (sporulation/competence/biofilm development) regulator YlbF (YheA/YmcA/DUF963 family)